MTTTDVFTTMSDDDLLAETRRLAAAERGVKAELIRALREMDARRLYLGQGCSSLFAYCTRVLHLSEHAAYGRIEAARCARRVPLVVNLLEAGDITLTTITLLAPHLTAENHRALLDEARHCSRRDVERIVARLRPQPDVPASVRKLPGPAARRAPAVVPPALVGHSAAPAPDPAPPPVAAPQAQPSRACVKPLAPARYALRLTIGQDAHDLLELVRALLRHAVPDGDLAVVFERALRALLRELERTRLAAATRPRVPRPVSKRSRHVPAAVRRAVWTRDGARCAFVGADGLRCDSTAFLELHHLVPFAEGGSSTEANLSVRCKAHNRHEADRWFGPMVVRETPPAWTVS
jgi:hypothetical protein